MRGYLTALSGCFLAACACLGRAGMVHVREGPAGYGDFSGALSRSGFVDERPAQTVLGGPFFIASHEVGKSLWDEVREWGLTNHYADLSEGRNGSSALPGEDGAHPVAGITWYDCLKWCNARSEREGLRPVYYADEAFSHVYRGGAFDLSRAHWDREANGYRLPTEFEWEVAARGGSVSNDYPWADRSVFYAENISPADARYSAAGTVPTGNYAPNAFGLYDMAGNVAEWCWDWYVADAHSGVISNGFRPGPDEAPLEGLRVTRGGSWLSGPRNLRCSSREPLAPSRQSDFTGFRCARSYVVQAVPEDRLRFSVADEQGVVVIRWRTGQEIETQGFQVFRDVNGAWVLVHAELVEAAGSGGGGARYSLVDDWAEPGETYLYKLVELEAYGQKDHGPFERTASELRMEKPVQNHGALMLLWQSRSGEFYRIQKSESMANGFATLASGIPATPPVNSYEVDAPVFVTYYRVMKEW